MTGGFRDTPQFNSADLLAYTSLLHITIAVDNWVANAEMTSAWS